MSPARVWPHHFDLGLLATLPEASAGPDSIGVGLSPGDENFEQPYLYVSPYPWPESWSPRDDDLSAGGFWNSKGFRGAVLLGEDLVRVDPCNRDEAALRFIEEAVSASLAAKVPG